MLDNVANLVLLVGLLAAHFDFDATFALRYMIPPTALGVLAGDLALTWMAFRLARRTGNNSVTAMPLASLFGVIHSPLAGNPLVIPWDMPDVPAAAHGQTPLHMAAGYALLALLLVAWAWWAKPKPLDDVES
jgi:hypothetical protein